ncbi:glycosyltransferase family 2 protein [Pediococcus acidilactici]|jgi:glycosyltransferase involved in cell wall biosynthesis|uniref:glycosyltransferase family 2 protein n=1 Tax=Pediococcus acidilactici TaxID=1254 RepID=UPI002F268BF1|nr:glycosyltransferase [Pediococcus acidilactici]
MILFSVIIPTFNSKNTIVETIESILSTREKELEIIVADDGSTDSTVNLIRKKKFPYVRVLNCSHIGPANIKNFAIKQATGDFICFLDSDDLIVEDYFKVLRKNLTKDLDLLVFNYKTFGDTNSEEEVKRVNLSLSGVGTMIWNKVYSKNLIQKLAFPKDTTYEDVGFSVQALLIANKAFYIDETLYCYRQRLGSVTKNPNKPVNTHLDIIKGFKELLSFISLHNLNLQKDNKRELSILVNNTILMHIRKVLKLYNVRDEEVKNTILKLLEFKNYVNETLGRRYTLLFSKIPKENCKFLIMFFLVKIKQWMLVKLIVSRNE